MSLDLKPEKVKPYLKMITEAVVIDSNNQGSLRKEIWDYLQKKYQKTVDYRDFLLAIRKFLFDGKMYNKEGYFSMHPEVIHEVRDKTPTPGLKKVEAKVAIENSVIASAVKPIQITKVNKNKESARQSKIQKYFSRKQMEPFGFDGFKQAQSESAKGLGFATPAPTGDNHKQADKEVKEQPVKQNQEIKKQSKDMMKGINQQHIKQQHQQRKKNLLQKISRQSKNIVKQKKIKEFYVKKSPKAVPKQVEESPKEEKKKEPKKEVEEKQAKETPKEKIAPKKEQETKFHRSNAFVEKKAKHAVNRTKHAEKPRKKQEKVDEQEEPVVKVERPKSQERSKKTKIIKKKDKVKAKKNKLDKKLTQSPQVLKKRTRGKTLDLKNLGILRERRLEPVYNKSKQEQEVPKESKQPIKKEKIEKPKKIKTPQKSKSQPKKKDIKKNKVQKVKRQSKKEDKAIEKKEKEQKKKEKKQDKILKQALKKKAKLLKEQLKESLLSGYIDRKAKLDCVKALKKLFSKARSNLFIDGKLIYV